MAVTKEIMLEMYTLMIRSHKMDDLMIQSIKDGKLVAFYHSLRGEEAVAVGSHAPKKRRLFVSLAPWSRCWLYPSEGWVAEELHR